MGCLDGSAILELKDALNAVHEIDLPLMSAFFRDAERDWFVEAPPCLDVSLVIAEIVFVFRDMNSKCDFHFTLQTLSAYCSVDHHHMAPLHDNTRLATQPRLSAS